MTAVKVVSAAGKAGAEVELPTEIFDAKVNVPLMHQVVVAQQAAARQGTHATKNRGAVRGGGKKPYRQKGTGRARQGSIRAPQFTGGGVVGGPVPRSYVQRTPKKMKAAALRGALSDRARNSRVHVVSGFTEGEQPSTREALATLVAVTGAVPDTAVALVVAAADDQLTWKSLRNARGVHLLAPGQLNTYDVLVSEHVVFTEDALAEFTGRVLPGQDEAAATRGAAAKDGAAKSSAPKSAAAGSSAPKSAVAGSGAAKSAEPKSAEPKSAASKSAEPKSAASKSAATRSSGTRSTAPKGAGTEDEQP
jgi:large subunit ribosomal protein L4